jgi:hypothetical protein
MADIEPTPAVISPQVEGGAFAGCYSVVTDKTYLRFYSRCLEKKANRRPLLWRRLARWRHHALDPQVRDDVAVVLTVMDSVPH